jgi:predicted dehydrogenase
MTSAADRSQPKIIDPPVNQVRIAVAGAGAIGLRHIDEIRESRSALLAGIVDPLPKAAEVAAKAGVRCYASLAELLAEERPDGIILATPNGMHVDQGLECIRAGVPALIEKPIADSVAEGSRLCDAAERAGVSLLVGHHRRHSPILRKACEIVNSGILGPLVGVIGSAVFYKPENYFDEALWRRQPGGGPILINMIHEVDSLRAMMGEIVAVQAFASSATRGHAVEDTVAINLRFANAALGTFLLSDTAGSARSWEQTSQENRSYSTYPDEDCYTIIGTDGSLAVPTMRLKHYASKQDRSWWKPFTASTIAVLRTDPLEAQIEHFAAVIRGEAAPLVTARDGLQNLRVTEAIRQAAPPGRIVETV